MLSNRIERKLQTIVYPRVYRICLREIDRKRRTNRNYVKYEVPTKISGEPHYNITECIQFLIINLRNERYQVYYKQPGDLIIMWNEYSGNISKLKDNLQFLYDEHQRTEEFKNKLSKNAYKAINIKAIDDNKNIEESNLPALPAPNKIKIGKKLPNLQF